jgi:hypothetical protein
MIRASVKDGFQLGTEFLFEDRLAFDEALFERNIANSTRDMLGEDLQAGR